MTPFESKLPDVGTTIFTIMSALAKEQGAINLSQGYPDFDCDDALKEKAYEYMNKGLNQYAPMRGVDTLLDAIAEKVKFMYGLTVDPGTEITVTSGAAEGIYSAITTIVHPGDEVIVLDPAYDLYKPAIKLNGGQAVIYSINAPDFNIDWNQVESLVTNRTKLLMINTPHNPIGRIMSAEDMNALQEIVKRHGIYVISDEVYEHLVFDGKRHESVLRYPELFQHSFAVFSFGKTFHNTGWRIGYCVAPKPLMKEFRKVHQFNVFSVITPIQYAIADYLHDRNTYINLPSFFEEKRDFLCNALDESRLRPLPSNGSYFQLYDYGEISDLSDVEFSKYITIEHGVAAIPISVFYTNPDPDERIIRLCFAKTEKVLAAAAERLCKI